MCGLHKRTGRQYDMVYSVSKITVKPAHQTTQLITIFYIQFILR